MYQNPPLNGNVDAENTNVSQEEHFDIYSNGLQQLPSNILYNDLSVACDYSGGLFVSDNVLHDVTSPTFHLTYPSNEIMQYNCSTEQASIQYPPQSVMNMSPPLPAVNSPQIQTNDTEIFRFNIPGFHIIILPISSPLVNLNNLDLQYQLQQNQLNQEQSYVCDDTQSTLNAQHQHQYDQQLNYLESTESLITSNFRNY